MVYLATDEAKNITGQLFIVGGDDVSFFPRPIQGPSILMRKIGKRTLDELSKAMPQMLP